MRRRFRSLMALRALVVDDDFHICDSVSKMLKQIGMRSEWTNIRQGSGVPCPDGI